MFACTPRMCPQNGNSALLIVYVLIAQTHVLGDADCTLSGQIWLASPHLHLYKLLRYLLRQLLVSTNEPQLVSGTFPQLFLKRMVSAYPHLPQISCQKEAYRKDCKTLNRTWKPWGENQGHYGSNKLRSYLLTLGKLWLRCYWNVRGAFCCICRNPASKRMWLISQLLMLNGLFIH